MSTINVTNPLQEAEREWEERTLEPALEAIAGNQEEFHNRFA